MKSKIYLDGNDIQAVTASRLYSNLEGENLDDFQFRIHQLILADLDASGATLDGELEFVVIDADYLSDFSDVMLKEAYRVAKAPVQLRLLESAMDDRLLDYSDIRKAAKIPTLTRTLEEAKASPEYKEADARRGMLCMWTDEGVSYCGVVQTIYLNNAHTVINYNVKFNDGKIKSVSENKKPTFRDA